METLAERIARDGPVNELDAIGWAIRLAKRLEALHQLGVAHGSVSPACILTAGQDRNARAYLADVQHTTSTPAYQSPERIMGGDISTADDVWALASTLYALLTGQSPFAGGSDAEVKQRIFAASPAPLAVFDVGDDDLQHIIDRSFTREMNGRTTNIMALRRALEEWHPDRGVANLPPLEDEDSTYDDDDVARTVMVRDASAFMAQKFNIQVPNQPGMGPAPPGMGPPSPRMQPPAAGMGPQSPRLGPPHMGPQSPRLGPPGGPPQPHMGPQSPRMAPPPQQPAGSDDDDDDDNVRTMMRAMPQDDLASMIAKASAAGAVPPARQQGPGQVPFPRPPQPGPPGMAGGPGRGVPPPQPPFGRPGSSPGFAAPPFGGPPPSAPQPPGQGPRPGPPAPGAPPPYGFGGRPAPPPAPEMPDDEDDEDDNARTMMRAPEYPDGPAAPTPPPGPRPAPGPYPAARPGPLGPPGARATALGGFQGAPPVPPDPGRFPQHGSAALGQQPAPYPVAAPNNAWGPPPETPAPAATMAFPAYDGSGSSGPFPDPRLGGGTNPLGMPPPNYGGGPPEPRLGGGTQPMGGPAMEAAMAAMAAHKQAMSMSGVGSGVGGPGQPPPGPPAPGFGGPPAPGFGGSPGFGGMAQPGFGGMAAPGDLSALDGQPGGQMAQYGQGMVGAPDMPGQVGAPAPTRSGKGLLIIAAIVALLIAAGVTFVILRSRAG